MERGIEHFAEGLSAVFQKMATALKPGAPLAFTFHHNRAGILCPRRYGDAQCGLRMRRVSPVPRRNGRFHFISTGPVPQSLTACSCAGPPAQCQKGGVTTASGMAANRGGGLGGAPGQGALDFTQ